jgi:hypothetical protein
MKAFSIYFKDEDTDNLEFVQAVRDTLRGEEPKK